MHEGERGSAAESAFVDQFRNHIQSLQDQLKGDATVALIDAKELTAEEEGMWQEYTHALGELIVTLKNASEESTEELQHILGSFKDIGVRSKKNGERFVKEEKIGRAQFYKWLNNRLSLPIMNGSMVLADLGNRDFMEQELPEIIRELEAEFEKMEM